MKKLLTIWTLNKLESDPKLFGGDNGNSAIMLHYLSEMQEDDKISNVPLNTMSNAVSVSRIKNELLKKYPQYDFRVKNKAQDKEEHPDQRSLFNIRELISDKEARIVKYLDGDVKRWDFTPKRIMKSIRGEVNEADVICILKYKELYQNGDT